MKHLSTTLAWLFVLCCLVSSHVAFAQCHDQARNRYEKIFCDIKTKGEGGSLPSLEDFRRNSAQVQALLLKRPAARLGIALPRLKRPKSKTIVATPRPKTPTTSRKKQVATKAATVAKSARPKPIVSHNTDTDCRLNAEVILCGKVSYKLALNKQNTDLDDGVLSEKNQLGLKPYRGRPGDQAALLTHLSESYRRYIEKMLEIGLGSATMSFSKFYYTRQTLIQQGQDFVSRFETMFGFLKKDKAGMAIKPRYNKQLPESMRYCAEFTQRLIVCESGENNWIYVKA